MTTDVAHSLGRTGVSNRDPIATDANVLTGRSVPIPGTNANASPRIWRVRWFSCCTASRTRATST